MTPGEAAQILEALARGIDPETGEVLPEDSPINSTHVVRALFLGAKALNESSPLKPPRRPTEGGVEQAWKPWTKDEDARLLIAFEHGVSVEALESLLRHPQNLAAMGKSARVRVLEQFGPDRFEAAGRTIAERLKSILRHER